MYGMLSGQQPPGLPLFQQGHLQLNSSSTHHHQQGSCLWTSASAAAATPKWETSAVSSQQQPHQHQHQQQQDQVAASVLVEPTSVLDLRSPSSPNNSRALSSSCSSDAAPTALSHSSASHARLAAVSSASSSQQEQLVAQQLEEFSIQQHGGGSSSGGGAGGIGVGYDGSLHDQQQQQQPQPPASLSLFYSGVGIRQIDTGGGLEWPGIAAADLWLASSQPDPSRRQLEDLESELMCPSPPPPAATSGADNSSLIRWLLGGGDGGGAEQSGWEPARPLPLAAPPLLQHHHPTMVKQELLDDDPFRQQQEWMMQHRQQQSSIPPQLAHLESFTRRTLPIPSPPPLLRPFSMAEAPIHRVPTTNWPPPPPPAPQQQQRDPFISLMQQPQQQQQQRQPQMGLSAQQQQQQLRELQASLSNKRALFEGSGSSCQQQPVKLARLTPPPASVHAQLGHLQQTIASPGAQWSPGDDVGGARRSQQQPQQQPPLAHRLLLRAAEACECGREELAQSILARLNEHQQQQQQQEQGQSDQQLSMAFLFRDALLESMLATTSATTEASSPALQMFERVAAFKALCEASPVLRFAHFTANQAIADATQGDDDVHIVDLSEVAAPSRSRSRRCSTFGGQWASFVVTAAATSRRRRRRIRVTLVSSAGEPSIQFAVESLREFAAASTPSTEFEFRGVAVEPGGSLPGPVELGVRSGEAIVVNLVFPDAATAPVLLAATRSLSPRVVALVDRDLGPAGGLAARLREGLEYYTAMADSCVASGAASLAEVERLVWRPEIDELLLGDATATGALRPAAVAAAGFRPLRLSDACERQAECLLSPDKQQRQQRADNLIEFARDDGRLVLLGHRGKVLATASAWIAPP